MMNFFPLRFAAKSLELPFSVRASASSCLVTTIQANFLGPHKKGVTYYNFSFCIYMMNSLHFAICNRKTRITVFRQNISSFRFLPVR